MLSIEMTGKFSKTTAYLNKLKELKILSSLERYGAQGVSALQAATPVDTGLTAASWSYAVISQNGKYSLVFKNSNVVNGVPIAIILQYGHGTGSGGYVVGRDYINPAIQPIFDQILSDLRREVASL